VFEREIPGADEEVFTAFADTVNRTEWGAPSDTEQKMVIYDETEFREAGKIGFRRGQVEYQYSRERRRYLEIVPNRRVVSAKTIV